MFQLWIQALRNPTEENYELIFKENSPSAGTTAVWILIAAVASAIFGGLGYLISGAPNLNGQELPFDPSAFLWIGICVTPILSLVGFYFGAGLIYFGAKIFKGQGDFNSQTYLQAMGSAPLIIVTAALNVIPFCGSLIAFLVSFFSLYLNILAVKVAHRLDWGQAIGAVLIPAFAFGFLICCCAFLLLSIAGATTGDIFEQIQATLQP